MDLAPVSPVKSPVTPNLLLQTIKNYTLLVLFQQT